MNKGLMIVLYRDLIDLAVARERSNLFEEAETFFAEALEKGAGDAQLLDTVGRFYYRRAQLEKAYPLLEKARKLSKGRIGCATTLVAAYKRLGMDKNRKQLMSKLERSKYLSPKDYFLLGDYLAENAKRREEANGYYRAGIKKVKLSPAYDVRYAKFLMRLAKLEMGRDELLSAKKYLEQGLKLSSSHGKLKDQYGTTFIQLARRFSKISSQLKEADVCFARGLESLSDKSVYEAEYQKLNTLVRKKMGDTYLGHLRFGTFLNKQGQYDEALVILKKAQSFAPENDVRYALPLGDCLFTLKKFDKANDYFQLALKEEPAKAKGILPRLSDLETSRGNYEAAIGYLHQLNQVADDNKTSNRNRRIHILRLRQKNYSDVDKDILSVCSDYFIANNPKLDEEQKRILDELVDKGICMSDFDSLFGKKHQNLWDAAEQQVKAFAEDPDIKALEKRISECEDFNADSFFAKSFKPSIVNYRLVKGEMYATEAAYQLYLNKRILDIANSYNEMLSKIRNVALWMNPPITGKNVGERKGSQIWHRDQEDENILKCFVYYTDVEEGCGPTEYIPYSKVKPHKKYSDVLAYPSTSGYPGDYLINKHIDPKDMMAAKGKKGSIMFFDTNGFHRGGYVTKERRIITMATFLRPITPFAATNTKLSMEGFDKDAYPFEASYGVAP